MCKYVYYPSEFLCVPHPVHVQTNKLSITLSEDVKRAIWHFPYWKTDKHPTIDFYQKKTRRWVFFLGLLLLNAKSRVLQTH